MLVERDINLRKEFAELQNQFGVHILLIRATKYVRCKCYNPLHQAGDPSCKICMGNGHLTTMEKVKGIHQGSPMLNRNDELRNTEIGLASSQETAFYVPHTVRPKARDHVVYIGWDSKGLPQEVQKVYQVIASKEIRGDKGRVELYGLNLKLRADMLHTYNKNVKSLPSKAKEMIAKGKRYVWPIDKADSI